MVRFYDHKGQEITTNTGIANILKTIFNSTEEAYRTLHSIETPPQCPCGGWLRFRSFLKGYDELCHDCMIERSVRDLRDAKRSFSYNDFIQFYYRHIDFYPDFRKDQSNSVEPFTGRHTKYYNMYGYLRKYFGTDNFPDKSATCLKCREISHLNFFEREFCCRSRHCRNDNRYAETREQKQRRVQEKWDDRNQTWDYRCKSTGKLLHLKPKSNVFHKHLEELGLDILNYLKTFEPELIRKCDLCGTEINPDYPNPLRLYKDTPSGFMFCSKQHYHAFRSTNPGTVQQIDDDQRRKHSKYMKAKIASGEFTPTRNHWRNWYAENDKRYRSRWEMVFHKAYPRLEYESVRIPYIDIDGTPRTYIVDFFDPKERICYEVKPSTEFANARVQAKTVAAMQFCAEKEILFKFVTERDILAILLESPDLDDSACSLTKILKKQFGKSLFAASNPSDEKP